MALLQAGFARLDITPPLGIEISGYYVKRIADGVLDPLTVNALALELEGKEIILVSMDMLGLYGPEADTIRKAIAQSQNLPEESIYIHCTHTHTGPKLLIEQPDSLEEEYVEYLHHKAQDVVTLARADRKPAKMGYGIGQAPNVAFVRRFRMKDGSVRTNPGVNNPDIVAPIGDVDERVTVLRFDREGGETIVLVNFANHPDTVGGCKISADWPGFVRQTVEKTLDNTKCLTFNGAQGDVNHVNVHPTGGYLNDMFMDFDDVARGYAHARYIGRVVAAGVLQAYDKVKYVEVDKLRFAQKIIRVPANLPTQDELAEAKKIYELYLDGKSDQLPYTGMMLTTVVARSKRMVLLENGPEAFDMRLSAVSIGDVAFVGIPGEPFTGIGRGLKETQGYELVVPTCLTNGAMGYFPMMECYEEGGYEAGSSNFKAGVAELLISEGQKLLAELREE